MAQGLSKYPVPKFVYSLFLKQKTGCLTVELGRAKGLLWLKGGTPVASSRNDDGISVYELAIELGMLKRDFTLPERSNSTDKKLACSYLVENGHISAAQAEELKQQKLHRDFGSFCLSDSEPTFDEQEIPEDLPTAQVNLFQLLFFVFTNYNSPQQIQQIEAGYQSVLLQPNLNLKYMLPAIDLPLHVMQSLKSWEKPRGLNDLYVVSGLNQRETLAVLSMLEMIDTLTIKNKPEQRSTISAMPAADSGRNVEIRQTRPTAAAATRPAPVRASAPPRPATTQKSSAELEKDIQDWLERVKSNNPFRILDVEPEATAGDIKKAFAVLIRKFHPDRLSASHRQDLVLKAERIFAAISNANNVLQNKEKRREVEGCLDDPLVNGDLKKLDMKKRAALEIEKMRVFFKTGDYKQAASSARRALGIFPWSTDALSVLAFSQYYVAKDKDAARIDALKLLDRALKFDPNSEIANYYKGFLARLAGDFATARQLYEKVLRINPKHPDAGRELNQLNSKQR